MQPTPPYILVLDDEVEIVRMLRDMLTDEGYTVRGVQEGQTALTLISAELPALVLLDYSMPLMNGAEFARRVRAGGYKVPLVLMSAGARLDTLQLPEIDDSIAKPFDVERLLALVEHYLPSTGTDQAAGAS